MHIYLDLVVLQWGIVEVSGGEVWKSADIQISLSSAILDFERQFT